MNSCPKWPDCHCDSIATCADISDLAERSAVAFIRVLTEEFVQRGYPAGDRIVLLANVRELLDRAAMWRHVEKNPFRAADFLQRADVNNPAGWTEDARRLASESMQRWGGT